MVVAARGEEGRAVAQSLYHLKTKYIVIEVDCPRKIGNFQMDMTDPRPCIHWLKRHMHYATLPT